MFEKKNVAFFKEISDKRNSIEKDFETERKIFETEIHKLSKKLSELTTEILKEQKVKSDLQKQFDLILEEINVLSAKVKKLEEINLKVDLSEQASPNTVVQSPYSSSSPSTTNSSKKSVKSNEFSKDRIRPSNLFYNSLVDDSNNQVFRKVKMVWRKKPTTESSDGNKSHDSPVVDAKSSISKTDSPTYVYSTGKLISLRRQTICCIYCGKSDFVHPRYVNSWYGTYSIPNPQFNSFKAKAINHQGSITAWIPKPKPS
ncbi:hypothetical protein L6452_20223 [Arctium lappa]|uniref:Uncharacterized protein n=1 Tax=Arctium lappa TaxID=4217 RepID=A0ACB9BC16_ARCLA|nr:hypothetical protein L6452_20223 [Arctium lappa]